MSSRPDYMETGWTGGRNPWAIAIVVTLATFMEILDTSIANVSLPHIGGSLSATQEESTWVLTSYLVANAIILPISGWLATRIGRKRFYMISVALFVVSSFLCGIAPTLPLLVFFRVLQGLGGGGLAPSEQAILADTFPPARRAMAMAVYDMAVVLAPAVGPAVGGYITDHFSWRWVFFINLPVGLISLLLTSRIVSDPPHLAEMRRNAGPVDVMGLGLVALGLGTLEFVLDKGQEDDWFQSPTIILFALVAATSLIAFLIWEWRQKHPVLDVRMLASRTFASSTGMMFVLGVLLYGPVVLLPAFEQVLMGYSAQQAGQTLSPGGFTMMVLMPIAGALVARFDARALIAVGLSALSASLLYMSGHLYTGIDFQTAALMRVAQVVGFAFLFVPINTLAYSGIRPEKFNAVSGIMNLARNIGGSAGIALVTTVIARRAQVHQSQLAGPTTGGGNLTARLHGVAQALQHAGSSSADAATKALALMYRQLQVQATQLAYLDAFRILAVAAACALPLVLLARAPRPGKPVGGGGH